MDQQHDNIWQRRWHRDRDNQPKSVACTHIQVTHICRALSPSHRAHSNAAFCMVAESILFPPEYDVIGTETGMTVGRVLCSWVYA